MKLKMMLAAAVALGMSATALAEVKVGTIDMQKAIQTTEAGKKAKKEFLHSFLKKV